MSQIGPCLFTYSLSLSPFLSLSLSVCPCYIYVCVTVSLSVASGHQNHCLNHSIFELETFIPRLLTRIITVHNPEITLCTFSLLISTAAMLEVNNLQALSFLYVCPKSIPFCSCTVQIVAKSVKGLDRFARACAILISFLAFSATSCCNETSAWAASVSSRGFSSV